eukprot:1308905-Pyramimonas_sp.AAC.1
MPNGIDATARRSLRTIGECPSGHYTITIVTTTNDPLGPRPSSSTGLGQHRSHAGPAQEAPLGAG